MIELFLIVWVFLGQFFLSWSNYDWELAKKSYEMLWILGHNFWVIIRNFLNIFSTEPTSKAQVNGHLRFCEIVFAHPWKKDWNKSWFGFAITRILQCITHYVLVQVGIYSDKFSPETLNRFLTPPESSILCQIR